MQNKKTNKASKYNYYSILQGNYGYGWDDLATYPKEKATKELRRDYKDYQKNEPRYSHRIISRRVLNENSNLKLFK
jgi:hypothetical protein